MTETRPPMVTWKCRECGRSWKAATVYQPCLCGSNKIDLVSYE